MREAYVTEQRLTVEETELWLKSHVAPLGQMMFDLDSQQFIAEDESGVFKLTLPLICPPLSDTTVDAAVKQFLAQRFNALILLVQAGYAALGYCEGDTLVRHEMVKKYMVRQSQRGFF
ncbi:MAG: hypothetical protein JXR76_31690 [Deltaproteobacteria bacterium]|nr:hypothetical protein [Deltaproteobacteria bacterium]